MLALIFGVFGVAFAAALLVAATGSDRAAASLAMAACAGAGHVALPRAAASPIAAFVAALPSRPAGCGATAGRAVGLSACA